MIPKEEDGHADAGGIFRKRPEKTTRVRVEISFLDEKTMRIILTDLGFGELFPATGAKVITRGVML
ncbi:MAG: DUF5716 family protein [Clostridium sp.]